MKTNKTILCACALVATVFAACSPENQPNSPLGDGAFKTTPPPVQPAPGAVQRPISEFIKFQGLYCDPDPAGNCMTYVQPVQNLLTWFDQDDQRAIWIDYAGLGDQWMMQQTSGKRGFGTRFTGYISEEPTPDGHARVTVDLHGYNVMAFVTQGPDLKGSPVIYGRRVQDAMPEGSQPALGEAHIQLVFINDAMGAPMPDLVQLIKTPSPFQWIISMTVKYNGSGSLQQPYTDVPGATGRIEFFQNGPAMADYAGTGMVNGPGASADLQITKMEPTVTYVGK